jgi:hypothetical protein
VDLSYQLLVSSPKSSAQNLDLPSVCKVSYSDGARRRRVSHSQAKVGSHLRGDPFDEATQPRPAGVVRRDFDETSAKLSRVAPPTRWRWPADSFKVAFAQISSFLIQAKVQRLRQ